jgi:hypothetical protein
MITKTLNDLSKIRVVIALASLLLSLIAVYFDDVINADGILYTNMADAFLSGGLGETAKLYNWPFYPIIIALIHKLTALPIEISAHFLNCLLFILLNDTLVRISHKILPGKNQILAAALLTICFQPINEYRDFIIRDIGYWAFSALALYYFILYIERPTIKIATSWQLAAIIAVLFRVEGIVLLIGLPFFLFTTQKPKNALRQILQLNYLVIISLIPASLIALNSIGSHTAFNKIDSIKDYASINNFLIILDNKAAILKTQILNEYSEKYSEIILVSGLLFMILFKLIKAFGLGYIALYLTSLRQIKIIKSSPEHSLLYYFFTLNMIILIVFVLHKYFITTRHIVLTLISLLLIALPPLCGFLEKAWSEKNRVILAFAGIILSFNLVDNVVRSNSKSYIKNTAFWAADNLTQRSSVLSDEKLITYYVKMQNTHTNITTDSLENYRNYDYVIIIKKKKYAENPHIENDKKLVLVYSSKNKRGDSASIYKIN